MFLATYRYVKPFFHGVDEKRRGKDMKHIHFGKVFVLYILLLTVGCSSGQGGGILSSILGGIVGETSSETPSVPSVGGGSAAEQPSGSDPSGSEDAGDDATDTENLPQATIPAPANDGTIITSPDTQLFAVVQAEGGHEPDALLVITNDNAMALARAAQEHRNFFAQATDAVRSTFAKIWENISPTSIAQNLPDFCNDTYRRCVRVNPDGSFGAVDVTYNADRGDQLTFQYYDEATQSFGDAITESHLSGVGYTAQPAAGSMALAKNASGDLFQVGPDTDGLGNPISKVVSLTSSPEGYVPTSGNFETGYSYGQVDDSREGLALNGNEFIYRQDSVVDSFLTCTSTDPIFGCLMDASSSDFNSNAVCNPDLGCSTNGVKVKTATNAANNRVYYSTEYESVASDEDEKIQELHNTAYSIPIFPDSFSETVYFLNADTLITTPIPDYTGTLAFDTHNNPTDGEPQDILVVMRDDAGDLKLVGRWTDEATSETPVLSLNLNSLSDIRDLEIYQNQNPENSPSDCTNAVSWNNGAAAILTGTSVEFVSYDLKLTECLSPLITDSYHLTHNSSASIAISNVIGWTLNDANTRAYVLNPTTITVINLQTKQVINTIALNSLFPGKSITISPKSILYHQDSDNETVLVGTDALKLILSYDVKE